MRNRSKVSKLFVFMIALLLIGLGLYYIKHNQKPKEEQVKFASLAAHKVCGPDALTPDQLKSVSSLVYTKGEVSAEFSKNLIPRVLFALPEKLRQMYLEKNIKFGFVTLDTREDFPDLAEKSRTMFDPWGLPTAVSIGLGSDVELLLLTPDLDTGESLIAFEKTYKDSDVFLRALHETLIPAAFWRLFDAEVKVRFRQEIYNPQDVSFQSQWLGFQTKLASLVTVSKEEKDFYLQKFPGAGIQSADYALRTSILFATQLYCNQETFSLLKTRQSEAFTWAAPRFICTMGRPFFMNDDEFKGLCN